MTEVVEVAEHRDLERANSRFGEFVNALFDAHELVLCWQGLSCLPPEMFTERLRKVSDGPACYDAERAATSTNLARNTMFELLVTTQLASSGLAIEDELPTDVAFRTDMTTILVECQSFGEARKIRGID